MHEPYMKRCLELASKGWGKVSPNPMVGAVIVHAGKIIGEGYHQGYGKPHAEVQAIASVQDPSLLKESTLYVNLEPCNHHGKTPPCTELILKHAIGKVVICNEDPNPLVAGKGIARLKENGVVVQTAICSREGYQLNRRFFTFHSKKRPYVILKWAQTRDGFIDKIRNDSNPIIHSISSEESHRLSHQWRTEESAILVGKQTVLNDNPQLTARLMEGNHPVRIVLDARLEIPETFQIYNQDSKTIFLNQLKEEKKGNIHFHRMPSSTFAIREIMDFLYSENIQSVIVEGGKQTLENFLESGIWDEARIFTSRDEWKTGLKAPEMHLSPNETTLIGNDTLNIYFNA